MICIEEIKTGEVTRVPNEEAVKKVKTEKFRYTDRDAWEAYRKEQEKKSVFKARYIVGPAHINVQLFTAKATNMTYANIGSLTMSLEDWIQFREILKAGRVEIVETPRPSNVVPTSQLVYPDRA